MTAGRAYGPIQVMPSAAVLHYAQEIFEGLKAYRHEDGSVWSFRPEANAERMQRSARRLALPELPTEDFLGSLRALARGRRAVGAAGRHRGDEPLPAAVHVRLRGVPRRAPGQRGHLLRHRLAGGSLLPRWPEARDPVALRSTTPAPAPAAPGPPSAAATTPRPSPGQLEGIEHGCDQAVFLDSSTQTYIEELGGMNLFFVTRDNRLVTPELTGSILEGVTRSSILELAKELGLDPQERRVPIEEWKDGVASGEIREIFACGTAAVVTPVASSAGRAGPRPRPPAGTVARSPTPSGAPSSTSSTAAPRTRTAGSPGSPDVKVHLRTIHTAYSLL